MKGGVYAIEITYNREQKTWHPHIHCLYDAPGHLPASRNNFLRFKRRIEFDWLCLTGGKSEGWRSGDFDFWYRESFAHKAGDTWNRNNRRVCDVRPVRDRKRAAFEVLKYITKASHFADVPEAIEQLLPAVRGVRMLQTFGTWYGAKLDDPITAQNAAGRLQCECGKNHWQNMGRFRFESVELKPDGKWRVKDEMVEMRRLCRARTG